MKNIDKDDDTPMVMDQRQKIDCPLIGSNGHIMNLSSISMRTLIENGQENEALEMWKRIRKTKNYDEAVSVIGEYVNFTEAEPDITVDPDEAFRMKM